MGYDWDDGKGSVHSRVKRTPAQLRRATARRDRRDPDYFLRPQTLGDGLRAADRATALQYGGLDSQLAQRQTNIPDWFAQYRQQIGQAQVAQRGRDDAVIAQAQGTEQAMAQKTLGGVEGIDPTGKAATDDALAAASRELVAKAFTAALTQSKQANDQYYTDRVGVSGAAELAAKMDTSRLLEDLVREKGAFRSEYLTDFGDREHTKSLERKAFDLDVYQANTTAANTRADNKRAERDARVQQQGRDADDARDRSKFIAQYGISPEQASDGISPAERKTMREHGAGTVKPVKPDKGANRDLRSAIAKVQSKLAGKETAPSSFWNQAYDALVNELDMDPAIARAAVQLVRVGRVGRQTRATLRDDYGITKFPRGSKRRKPKPYVRPDSPSDAAQGGYGQG